MGSEGRSIGGGGEGRGWEGMRIEVNGIFVF